MENFGFSRSIGFVLAMLCATCSDGLSDAALGRAFIDMGHKDQIAGHQPQAQIEIFTSDGSTSLGPSAATDDPLAGIFGTTSTLLVDTGASSIFLMNDAETVVKQNGFVIDNQVLEQGVSGFSLVNVSAPYQIHITDDIGAEHVIQNNRMLSGQFPDLFGINGLIGMPGMVGRVMSIDLDVVFDPNDILNFQLPKTTFSSSLPTDFGHRYSIPLTAKRFDIEDENPPLPTSAPLPMLTAEAGAGTQKKSGQFLLDTGASISFISTEIATSLGLDTNGDGQFTGEDDRHFDDLPIGGVGGSVSRPMFLIDTLSVATNQNVDLVWDEVFVLVLDVHPDIDGVLGSDALTSGLLNLLGLGEGEDSPIEAVSFDFRNFFEEGDAGNLVFDLNATYDTVQYPGDLDADTDVDAQDLAAWKNGFGSAYAGDDFLEWQQNFASQFPGDFNNSVNVDAQDLATWENGYGSTYTGTDFLTWQQNLSSISNATNAVPEPASALLLLVAAASMLSRPPSR